MNLEEELLKEHSRRQADRIASWIGSDRRRFKSLMSVFLNGERQQAQRSAWVLSICAENEPRLVAPYLKEMVARMRQSGVHDAVKRNVVRILQHVEIPEALLGTVVSVCFEYLSDARAPVAVKAFSMTVLARIAQSKPDLKRELRLVIGEQLPFASKGFHARARQVMKVIGEKEPGRSSRSHSTQ